MIRVGIDVDGVIGGFLQACRTITMSPPTATFEDCCKMVGDEDGLWRMIRVFGEVFHTNFLHPLPFAVAGIEALIRDPAFDVRIVTSLPDPDHAPATWCADRTRWLRRHFDIGRHRICFMEDKGTFHGDVLIDDWTKQLKRFCASSPHHRGLLFMQPHNVGADMNSVPEHQWDVLQDWHDPKWTKEVIEGLVSA